MGFPETWDHLHKWLRQLPPKKDASRIRELERLNSVSFSETDFANWKDVLAEPSDSFDTTRWCLNKVICVIKWNSSSLFRHPREAAEDPLQAQAITKIFGALHCAHIEDFTISECDPYGWQRSHTFLRDAFVLELCKVFEQTHGGKKSLSRLSEALLSIDVHLLIEALLLLDREFVKKRAEIVAINKTHSDGVENKGSSNSDGHD